MRERGAAPINNSVGLEKSNARASRLLLLELGCMFGATSRGSQPLNKMVFGGSTSVEMALDGPRPPSRIIENSRRRSRWHLESLQREYVGVSK